MKLVVTALRAAVLLLVFALLAAGIGWAQSEEQQQSLGDAARKQREKKGQAEPKGTKVLTNDDLPTSGGLATPGASSGTAASPASAAGEAPADAAAAPGEKPAAVTGEDSGMTAAEEADAAKKKLEGLKHDEQSYKNGISHFEELISNETNESRRELYRNAMQHGQQRLSENLKQQAETEKEVAAKEAAAKQQQQNQPPPAPPPAQPPQ